MKFLLTVILILVISFTFSFLANAEDLTEPETNTEVTTIEPTTDLETTVETTTMQLNPEPETTIEESTNEEPSTEEATTEEPASTEYDLQNIGYRVETISAILFIMLVGGIVLIICLIFWKLFDLIIN